MCEFCIGRERTDGIRNFVIEGYREILLREPDPEGFAYFVGEISNGTISKERFLEILRTSEEYKSVINVSNSFVIGNKTYDISYDPNDNYFNFKAARISRSGELGCLSQILGQLLHKKAEGLIDVGANIGLITLLMGQFVNDSRNILSIEPNQIAYKYLKHNCVSNHMNPIIKNCGVSDIQGNLQYCNMISSTAISHLVTKDHIINNSVSYDVKVEQLDTLVDEAGLKQGDFIKIDTEGHEWQVLKGSINTLKKFNPWIFLEFNSWTLIAYSNINPRTFIEYLVDTYQQVGQVRHGQDVLWVKSRQDVMNFIHDNLVKHGCVDNLLVRYVKEDS